MAASACRRALVALTLCVCLATTSLAYEFDLVFQTKCIMEEVPINTEVTSSYSIFKKDDETTPLELDVRVSGRLWCLLYI